MISHDLAIELKNILEQDFNISITYEEAAGISSDWLDYFEVLLALQQGWKKGQDGKQF